LSRYRVLVHATHRQRHVWLRILTAALAPVALPVPAAGGWWSYACSGSSESLWWGCSAAASLAFAAMAMSDMTDDNIFGHLGVKLAWGETAAAVSKPSPAWHWHASSLCARCC
jgi:hypothetical protein